jgi:hypothetical protein
LDVGAFYLFSILFLAAATERDEAISLLNSQELELRVVRTKLLGRRFSSGELQRRCETVHK